jgi:hypothetical protein
VLGSVSMTGGAGAWVSGEVLFLKVYYGIFFQFGKEPWVIWTGRDGFNFVVLGLGSSWAVVEFFWPIVEFQSNAHTVSMCLGKI